MQIHELDNYNGELNSGAYFAVDNGTDTGKVTAVQLLRDLTEEVDDLDTSLNARIDNIIAGGTAPSEAEVTDARLGADGVLYSSLGTAIRSQIESAYKSILSDRLYYNYAWEVGTIKGTDGTNNYNANTYRTKDYGQTSDVDYLIITSQLCNAAVFYYNDNAGSYTGIYESVAGASAGTGLYKIKKDYLYFRVTFNKADYSGLPDLYDIGLFKPSADVAQISSVNLEEYDGYIGSDGSIVMSIVNGEKYTQQLPVSLGDSILFALEYGSAHQLWAAYATYDESGTFIARTAIQNNQNRTEKSVILTITDPTVKYISFTYRTYNDHTVTFRTNGIGNVLLSMIEENNPQWARYLTNDNVNSVNHRGYNKAAPENTLPAYKLSKKYGFKIVETDVRFTSDGVAVCLHDASINRTARNMDGTAISGTVNIDSITYAQAQTYDYGVWFSSEYAGTTIPTFEEFITLCRNLGLIPYVEVKAGTQGQIEQLIDDCNNLGMAGKVTWISDTSSYLEIIKNYDAAARIGLVVNNVDASVISTIIGLRTSKNEVFADASSYLATEIQLCKDDSVPLEVWTINSPATIIAFDPYITGVTSDYLVAGYELYKANL